MADKYNLENQYNLYLKRDGLKETDMHPIQKKETKRAFIGACGQILVLLRDDLSELPEKEGVQELESMLGQVGNFFLNETHKQN